MLEEWSRISRVSKASRSGTRWRTIKDELDHPNLMKMQAFWLLDALGKVIPDEDYSTGRWDTLLT